MGSGRCDVNRMCKGKFKAKARAPQLRRGPNASPRN
jgi:hypothetical protein